MWQHCCAAGRGRTGCTMAQTMRLNRWAVPYGIRVYQNVKQRSQAKCTCHRSCGMTPACQNSGCRFSFTAARPSFMSGPRKNAAWRCASCSAAASSACQGTACRNISNVDATAAGEAAAGAEATRHSKQRTCVHASGRCCKCHAVCKS